MGKRFIYIVFIILCVSSCQAPVSKSVSDKKTIQAEIDSILKIQEDAYGQNNEDGRKVLATTCDDSLIFVGGDNGGIAGSANYYVHDLADGYIKRPSEKIYRIYDETVIVSSVYQSFKVFDKDSIFFNARSTKVFVKSPRDGRWHL